MARRQSIKTVERSISAYLRKNANDSKALNKFNDMLASAGDNDFHRSRREAHEGATRILANAQGGAYRARRNRQMPSWANRQKIRAMYAEAHRLTLETGIPHHIDHIFPLKSSFVTGLHCEANLQILTAEDNLRKSNRINTGIEGEKFSREASGLDRESIELALFKQRMQARNVRGYCKTDLTPRLVKHATA